MEESIKNFSKQFGFKPEIIGAGKLSGNYKNYILGGMGGSHLAGGIFKIVNPKINLSIHRDYGLPGYITNDLEKPLFIACSHSGNTEEVLDFADEAYSKGYEIIVITTGGKLLNFAKENSLPYILVPNDGIQPRTALGYLILALYQIILPEEVTVLQAVGATLNPLKNSSEAKNLAESLKNKIPVIYTSSQNRNIAYNWKIKMNETAKIPAFYNSFPELNHNEMQGYDFVGENQVLSDKIQFVFIHDNADDERIEGRMKATEQLYQEKGMSVSSIFLEGNTPIEKIFNSLLLADLTALELSKIYNTEPEAVPLIEKFKKLI